MSAQIIQFIPRPRPVKPITNPIDFSIWYAEATADWLKQLNAIHDVITDTDPKTPA